MENFFVFLAAFIVLLIASKFLPKDGSDINEPKD